MTYATFDALKDAFDAGDVSPDEFRKYFSRLVGETFDGYPDFSSRYVETFLGRGDGKREECARKRRPRWVVVRSLCDSYGSVIRVEGAVVFKRLRDASAYLTGLEESEKSACRIGIRELVVPSPPDFFSYKLVEESSP